MRPTTSTVSRALPVLLAAGVVAIVLGIVGMHALNTHGVMSDTDHASMTDPMTGTMSASHADTAGVRTTEVAAAPDGGNGHDMGDMVMLCVSMLAAAAVTLLLLLALTRRIPRSWTRQRPAPPVRLTRWVAARLGTGPPPVWEFSVIRC
jgi:uncharacterized protein DUF6153